MFWKVLWICAPAVYLIATMKPVEGKPLVIQFTFHWPVLIVWVFLAHWIW